MALDLGVTFPQGTDERVKVSANDATTGYLLSKLQAGANVTLAEVNDGGIEKVQITAIGGIGGISIGDAIGGGTPGSVLFADAAGDLGQSNANLFWNTTFNGLSIAGGTGLSASVRLSIGGRTNFQGLITMNDNAIRFFDSSTTLSQSAGASPLILVGDNGFTLQTRPAAAGVTTFEVAKNGNIGFFGAATVAQQADPGNAGGADAAVINAIHTGLQNLGLFA